MDVSYVIVTHNRRERLLRTLETLACGADMRTGGAGGLESETWVVDNGSTDGTPEAIQRQFPGVNVIRRPTNEGVWARNYAFPRCGGEFVVLLDDDSYPVGDAVDRSVARLREKPRVAAVVGRAILPNGSCEACALPNVLISCAVTLRRQALEEVGGFRREFFRKAGEYDLSFRLMRAGWGLERFEDLEYRHDKELAGRDSHFAHRMDVRNNLILVHRFLPANLRRIYAVDWRRRYLAMARAAGAMRAARLGVLQSYGWATRCALGGREVLAEAALEAALGFEAQARMVAQWAMREGVKRVVIGDWGKNLYATFEACRRAGLEVAAVAEAQKAFVGLEYRGLPIISNESCRGLKAQGAVLSNLNPAQIQGRTERLRQCLGVPVLSLWQPKLLGRSTPAAAPGPALKGAA